MPVYDVSVALPPRPYWTRPMKALLFLILVTACASVRAQDYQQRREINDLRRAIARDVQRITAGNAFQTDRRKYYRWKSSTLAPYGQLGKLPVTR